MKVFFFLSCSVGLFGQLYGSIGEGDIITPPSFNVTDDPDYSYPPDPYWVSIYLKFWFE